ncbi:MAG: SDR family oxidoreductase, partial [Rhizobiales bacterium]|nr:SDR family oxidoreductase [Hyphomicrobiales bacterium]
MTLLVVGASGATGHLLVQQLLERGEHVRMIVRATARLPKNIKNHANAEIITASLLDLSDEDLAKHVAGCSAVASCLGHNLSFKGIFGQPRRLVSDATRRLCAAIKANNPQTPVKFVLMNSSGVHQENVDAPIWFAQSLVIGLLRALVPPHVDNEMAAAVLRSDIGQNDPDIEWAIVRPDALIDADETSPRMLHPSPVRSAIFNAGKTSRINVAAFMADLMGDKALWDIWKGQMPMIYNT